MNTPNKISLARILCIPLFIFFYLATFVPYGKLIAVIVFAITGLTDFVDGYLARKYNQVTDLGKFLDPIADKLHMTSGLLLVVCDGTIPAPYGVLIAIIIIAREFIVTAFRQIAATKNFVMQADMWGKVKANFQPVSIAFFMFIAFLNAEGLAAANVINVLMIVGYVLIGIAVALTIISCVNYLVKNRQVLK